MNSAREREREPDSQGALTRSDTADVTEKQSAGKPNDRDTLSETSKDTKFSRQCIRPSRWRRIVFFYFFSFFFVAAHTSAYNNTMRRKMSQGRCNACIT